MAIVREQSLPRRSLRARTNLRRFLTWRYVSAAIPWIVLALGLIAYHQVYSVYRFDTPVHADAEGYFAYLPSYLIDHDLSFNFVITHHLIPAYARLGHQPPLYFGFYSQPSGNWLDKYGIGVALLDLPFFLVGHVSALVMHQHADGYSDATVYVAGAAGLFYTCAGLFALRAVMRRWFPHSVIALTLVAIVFGTSLFNFTTWDPLNSHAFSFFAVALLLLATVRWYEQPHSWWRAALIGALAGVIIDIRPTDAVLLLIVPLWGVGSVAAARARLLLLREHVLELVAMAGIALVIFVPEPITWHIATGHWFVQPYQDQGFDFLHPELLGSLFAFRPHGLLPYAPVLVFSFGGLMWMWFKRRDVAFPVTVTFLLFWYIVSAWYDWSFSDGFGQRAFIDILPLLALPMAFFFTSLLGLASLRGRLLRASALLFAVLFTAVTCALMLGYWQWRISGEGIDPPGYVAILAHPHHLTGPPEFPAWLLPVVPPGRR